MNNTGWLQHEADGATKLYKLSPANCNYQQKLLHVQYVDTNNYIVVSCFKDVTYSCIISRVANCSIPTCSISTCSQHGNCISRVGQALQCKNALKCFN